MKERPQPIEPKDLNSKTDWKQVFPIRGFFKLFILVEIVGLMLVKNVGWTKAKTTVEQKYYDKVSTTNEENFLFRPADLSAGEIGPQSTGAFSGGKYDWIFLALVILWLYNKIKAKK